MHSVVVDFGTERHLEELVDSALMMMDETEGVQLDRAKVRRCFET